jgi:hypothetical protein
MKPGSGSGFRRWAGWLAALAAAGLATSCTTVPAPQKRIAKNPALYQSLGAEDRRLVSQGKIREGMTREAVLLAWGKPDRVVAGSERGKAAEIWHYTVLRPQPVGGLGIGYGFGYPTFAHPDYRMGYPGYGYGFGWGPGFGWGNFGSVAYAEEPTAEVRFENGRVVSWQARR